MHASFSFHLLNLQLAYITQTWIFKKSCAMQVNNMKCTFKCTIQVYELAPPTCVLKILIDPFPLPISLPLCQNFPLVVFSVSPYVKFSPFLSFYYLSTLFLPLTLISLFFSPFVINDHKG